MPDEVERQSWVKTAILERVQDLSSEENLAVALIETGFDLLAARHLPARLTAGDRAAIRDNYADATPKLIASRSVDNAGVVEAVGTAEIYARISIDYSQLSCWKAAVQHPPMSAHAAATGRGGNVVLNGEPTLHRGGNSDRFTPISDFRTLKAFTPQQTYFSRSTRYCWFFVPRTRAAGRRISRDGLTNHINLADTGVCICRTTSDDNPTMSIRGLYA